MSQTNTNFRFSHGAVLAILAIIFLGFANIIPIAVAFVSPSVSTDNADYGHFETAAISGSGFGSGQVLSVLVTAPDGTTRSCNGAGSAGPDWVTADGSGAFVLSYRLSGTLPGGGTYQGQIGLYTVDVVNSAGAVLASTTFGDSPETYTTCAVTTAGGLKCWGYNGYGALAMATSERAATFP